MMPGSIDSDIGLIIGKRLFALVWPVVAFSCQAEGMVCIMLVLTAYMARIIVSLSASASSVPIYFISRRHLVRKYMIDA